MYHLPHACYMPSPASFLICSLQYSYYVKSTNYDARNYVTKDVKSRIFHIKYEALQAGEGMGDRVKGGSPE
jgi:hypothetical protein